MEDELDMYTWMNKEQTALWEANYCECCKHKWTIEKWGVENGSWKRTGAYKRFDTLEQAKAYAYNNF